MPPDPTLPTWSLIVDVARTLLLLGIPALLKYTNDIRHDVREQSERLKGVETWSVEHDKRDDDRFHELRDSITNRRGR